MENTCDSTSNIPDNECQTRTEDEATDIPEVFTVTWLYEDHIIELTQILQGVEADQVGCRLSRYVEENIEPVGWKAVWQYLEEESQSGPQTSNASCKEKVESSQSLYSHQQSHGSQCRYVVEVMNVDWEELEADVKYCANVNKDQDEAKQFTVPLTQLYPLAVQENEVLDIATTAEVIEQVRFFYNHIWHAWDLEEESCVYDHHLITTRIKLYNDIETGRIPSTIGSELRSIVKEANSVQNEIGRIEKCGDGDDVDQNKVSTLIHLHKTLEMLKSRFDLLQEPVLRELSGAHQSLDLLWTGTRRERSSAKVKIVLDCLSVGDLAQLSKLPDVLTKLTQVSNDATCQSFPTLQHALDAARKDDVIILLPGVHPLRHVGLLSHGGKLIGLGDNVIIEGSKAAGDILIDVTGDFLLQNVILRSATNQVGIVAHNGNLVLRNVHLEGGLTGVIGLGKTRTSIEDSTIKGCSDIGADIRDEAISTVTKSSLIECGVGIQMEENSKVSVTCCSVKNNVNYGILIVWPEDSDVSGFQLIPKEELLKSLLSNYEGNTLDQNKENAALITFKKKLDTNDLSTIAVKDSKPTGSTGSLDSGLDCVDTESK